MRRTTLLALIALAAGALAPKAARAGDFMDTRLSFNLTDEDLLGNPTLLQPQAAGLRFGTPVARWGTMFFDNYDTRFAGFENLTALVLYKSLKVGQSDFEGALVIRPNELSDNAIILYDAGSYLKWTYWLDPTRTNKTNLAVTAFPMSSDPLRLGYSYKISWGGSPIYFKPNPDNPYAIGVPANNPNPVPGLRVQLSGDRAYGFLAAKSTVLLNVKDNQQEAVGAVLGGAGVDLTPEWRLEANGGFFDRGTLPKEGVLGQPLDTFGGTGQIVYHHGVPVGRSIDFQLYKNDPTSSATWFKPETYPGGLTWLVSSEVTWTGTTLQNPDIPSSTTLAPGMAGDVNFRMKYNFLRLHADLMYRDLMFALLNVPGFDPNTALSSTSAKVTPEMFAAVGADYYFSGPHLTLGLTGGVDSPATYSGVFPKALAGNIPEEALPVSTTVVVQSEGNYELLPPKQAAAPIVAFEGTGKVDFGAFAVVGELYLDIDHNLTELQRNSAQDPYVRVPFNAFGLGFNLCFQAKF